MLGTRNRTTVTGLSKTSSLKPINESPVSKKFASMKLEDSPSPPTEVDPWEVRPGGMLVQKRDPQNNPVIGPSPIPICVRVKYVASYHEIRISPHASFGELKKMLSVETGLHPEGQKLIFKDKERASTSFLDMCGVKDRSKVVLEEDPTGQAMKSIELRKNAKMEKAVKTLHQISRDVDKLVTQVKALNSLVSKEKKVAESDIVGLTEQLMDLVLKLDAVVVEGDAKTQRRAEVKRVQKYVETLDALKVKNAQINKSQLQQQQQRPSQAQALVTTKWETFDLLSSMPSTSAAAVSTVSPAMSSAPAPAPVAHASPTHVRFNWELF